MIATTNDKNSHQTEGGSQLLSPVFISQLGSHEEGPFTPQFLNGTYTIPDGICRSTADFLSACQHHKTIAEVHGKAHICHQCKKAKQLWNIRREGNCTYNHRMRYYQATMRDDNLNWFFF